MPPEETAGPPPTFDVLRLSAEVRKAVDELGYVHPTPVQQAVFDPAARGADLLVQARTGTGKTASYGLPIVDSLVKRSVQAVQVLVLCPTRELALQVARELESLSRYRGTRIAAVYGGAPMGAQVQKINEGAQVIAGTPGRVLDHLRRGTLDPKGIRVVVLDESDEMLSMGFLPQIDEILSHLPASRQSLLFSATLPPDVQRLAETRLRNPEYVTLSGDQVGALEIAHYVYLSRSDKTADLVQVLEVENPESAIVFCNTRESTKRVAMALTNQGYDADWLNADLSQNEREKVMEATRSSRLRFLVATDVAARGIDISHLTHVINYDLPESAEAYVHRTGRTGRAGRTGTAISLIEPGDIGNLYMLRLTYKIRPIEKQLPTQRDLKTRAEMDVVGMFSELFSKQPAHADDLALARRLITHENGERIIAGLLRDHLGARPSAADQAAAARRAAPPRPAPAPKVAPMPKSATPAREAPAPARDAAAPAPARDAAAPAPARDVAAPAPARDVAAPAPARDVAAAPAPARDAAAPAPARDVAAPAKEPPKLPPPPATGAGMPSDPPTQRRPAGERRQPLEPTTVPPQVPALRRGQGERGGTAEEGGGRGEGRPRAGDGTEIYVNVGRKDGARASDFYAVLEQRAGVTIDDTDYVNVRQRNTFIGVRGELVEKALGALNGAVIAGREAKAEPSRDRN